MQYMQKRLRLAVAGTDAPAGRGDRFRDNAPAARRLSAHSTHVCATTVGTVPASTVETESEVDPTLPSHMFWWVLTKQDKELA